MFLKFIPLLFQSICFTFSIKKSWLKVIFKKNTCFYYLERSVRLSEDSLSTVCPCLFSADIVLCFLFLGRLLLRPPLLERVFWFSLKFGWLLDCIVIVLKVSLFNLFLKSIIEKSIKIKSMYSKECWFLSFEYRLWRIKFVSERRKKKKKTHDSGLFYKTFAADLYLIG